MLTLVRKALSRTHRRPDQRGVALVEDLPATPDDIDLDRIVEDPAYREAVKGLLRRWNHTGQGNSG